APEPALRRRPRRIASPPERLIARAPGGGQHVVGDGAGDVHGRRALDPVPSRDPVHLDHEGAAVLRPQEIDPRVVGLQEGGPPAPPPPGPPPGAAPPPRPRPPGPRSSPPPARAGPSPPPPAPPARRCGCPARRGGRTPGGRRPSGSPPGRGMCGRRDRRPRAAP